MNRSQLRAIAAYDSTNNYLDTQVERQVIAAANPATSGAMGSRDPATGKTQISTGGGTAQAQIITSAGIPSGTVIPSISNGVADAKPAG